MLRQYEHVDDIHIHLALYAQERTIFSHGPDI